MMTIDALRAKFPIDLPQELFLPILLNFTLEEIHLLQREELGEPLTHHLTKLVHSLEQILEEKQRGVQQIASHIASLNVLELDCHGFDLLEEMHQDQIENDARIIRLIDNALALAWSARRKDLVEKFTALNAACRRHYILVTETLPQDLDKRLNTVFESLTDDDPAIEGLAKLGLLKPEDFQAIGLDPKTLAFQTVGDLKDADIYSLKLLREKLTEE